MRVKSITIKEIANICGVGVSTVSRAINNHSDINPDTKARIEKVIEEYGYVPNNAARNLKITDSRNIAIIAKGITNPFFGKMYSVFERICSENNYSLILQDVEDRQNEIDLAISLIKEKRLSGIIFLGGNPSIYADHLSRIKVPVVFCSIALNGKEHINEYSYVAIDDRVESEKIVNHLYDTGSKRVAILAAEEEDESIGRLRLQGYLDAVRKNAIKFDENLILRSDRVDPYSAENGYNLCKRLIYRNIEFDSIYAISDTMAIGVLRALYEHDIKVPDDARVIGFDGLDIASYTVPRLSTVKQPVNEMAETAINILLKEIKEPGHKPVHKILNPKFELTESTGN